MADLEFMGWLKTESAVARELSRQRTSGCERAALEKCGERQAADWLKDPTACSLKISRTAANLAFILTITR